VWFDQSGEGNHATQADTLKQPKVYDSATGVVIESGRPVLSFDRRFFAVDSSTGSFNYLHDGTTSSVFVTAKFGDNNDPDALYGVFGNNAGGAAFVGAYFYYDDRASSSRNNTALLSIYNGDANNRVCDSIVNDVITANKQLIVYNQFNADDVTLNDRSIVGVDGSSAIGINTRNGVPVSSDASFNMEIGNQGGGSISTSFTGSMSELLFYPSDQSSRRVGIEDNLAEYYNLKEYRLLDRYPGAAAAYSLRLLSTSYLSDPEPYAVRVRRSSDNEEADIGFDGFGNLNVSLLEDFCAGADGFVSRWFDQSGSGNDASQIDEGAQPQIVASGSVITNTDNSLPVIQGITNNYFELTSTIINTGDFSIYTATTRQSGDMLYGGASPVYGI
jgi:hypothetical protein